MSMGISVCVYEYGYEYMCMYECMVYRYVHMPMHVYVYVSERVYKHEYGCMSMGMSV